MCDGMKQSGFIAIILLLLFFWPLAWIPCVMDECFEQQQRPVYGYDVNTRFLTLAAAYEDNKVHMSLHHSTSMLARI